MWNSLKCKVSSKIITLNHFVGIKLKKLQLIMIEIIKLWKSKEGLKIFICQFYHIYLGAVNAEQRSKCKRKK